MAVVKFGAIVQSITQRMQGSVFRRSRYGTILYSNNWSKRGHTHRHAQARFLQGCITSNIRNLTNAEKQSYSTQVGGWNVTRNPNRRTRINGSSSRHS